MNEEWKLSRNSLNRDVRKWMKKRKLVSYDGKYYRACESRKMLIKLKHAWVQKNKNIDSNE